MARLPQSNFRFFEKKKKTLKQKSAVKFPESSLGWTDLDICMTASICRND